MDFYPRDMRTNRCANLNSSTVKLKMAEKYQEVAMNVVLNLKGIDEIRYLPINNVAHSAERFYGGTIRQGAGEDLLTNGLLCTWHIFWEYVEYITDIGIDEFYCVYIYNLHRQIVIDIDLYRRLVLHHSLHRSRYGDVV